VKSASTSSPASVRGERFCLLSAGLLPGVRSPDRLYWFKRIPVDWCRTSTSAGGRRVALRGRDHAWPSLEWHSSAVAIAWFDGRRQAAMPRTESTMASKVFCDIAISADGYVAGPGQTAEKPFGDGPVDRLHAWMFDTPDENRAEIDQVAAAGAFVMGRNMFGAGRGEWDLSWKGWWGDNPPYHAPVFVLTRHSREPLAMEGGTTFTFVTDGIESALDQARKAAGDRDVAIAGGAATVNQYLAAGLIDEIRTHIAPVTIGAGERLFDGVPPLNLKIIAVRGASLTTHISYHVLH
jgi:dihydrofolate reductase